MAGSYSTPALALILIVGLVVGAVGVYAGMHSSAPLTTQTTVTYTTTSFSIVSVTVTASGSSSSGLGLAQFQSVLTNTKTINLTVASFSFGKGSLSVFFSNSGKGPIVLSPSEVIYNGSATNAAVYFAFTDSNVTQVGVYAYMPVGSEIFVSATPPNSPLAGQNATLQILNEEYTFTYGTSTS